MITAHQASLPQARRPSGAQPAVCMALNDLTVSPVTGRCENRRHQGHVRENEPPGWSSQFGLNGGESEARFIRAGQLLGSWRDIHKHKCVYRYYSDDSCSPHFCSSHLVMRPGFPRRAGRRSRSRLRPETCRRRFKLAFESAVKSGFGLISNFGCDLCHRITGRREHLRS